MEGNSKKAAPKVWAAIMGVTTAAAGLCCAFLLWIQGADGGLPYLLLAGIGLVCVGAIWFAAGIWGLIAYRTYLLTLLAPVLVLGAFALLLTGVMPKLSWWISRDAFTEVGTACAATSSDRWIGVYHIRHIGKYDGGCLFYTDGGLLDSVGFAYMPDGVPAAAHPGYARIEYTPFEGAWYRFSEPFD
ncbi:hypothetical protein AB0E01_29255 [Nocardia vinacea]|uniref:hypothetical protein n=1 Tax=Nocardia vinacea TaxID=96468 RepID=UPI003406E1E8